MISKDYSAKEIPLFPKLKNRNIFPGEWASIYRGEGVEFADTKPLEPDDDVRDIDLRELAKTGQEEIIRRVVERQMKVYVWADFSGSMQRFEEMFFPAKPEIRDIAIGLIIFSAANLYAPVGFFPFGLERKKFFPPRMGERYCWDIVKWIADEKNYNPFSSSGVRSAINSLLRLATPRNMVFFISDFKQMDFEKDFVELLRPVTGRFDFIPVIVMDPLETSGAIKRPTRISIRSSGGKTGGEIFCAKETIKEVQEISRSHLSNLGHNFRKLGIGYLVLNSPSIKDCEKTLTRFFQTRRRARR